MNGATKLKIVVTGGAGFIGSNLCDRLIQQGHKVICVDNLLSGDFANIRRKDSAYELFSLIRSTVIINSPMLRCRRATRRRFRR